MRHLLSFMVVGLVFGVSTSAFAQQGSHISGSAVGAKQRSEEAIAPLQYALQTLKQMRVAVAAGQCAKIRTVATRVLATPHMTNVDRHEAIQAFNQCRREGTPLAEQTRKLRTFRANLKSFLKNTTIKRQNQSLPHNTHIASWRIAGKSAAMASSAMVYLQIDVSPSLEAYQGGATRQEKRRFLEARNRLRQLHWLIPTIYSISGTITRDGIAVVDEDLNGREARLVPTWRSGRVGARLRIRF